MTARPLRRRMIAFSVPERSRIEGSTLYRANSMRGSLSRCEDIWLLSWGEQCTGEYRQGQKAYISDGFELEPADLDLWEQWQDHDAFQSLKQFAQEVDGKVKTSLVHEDSLLAVED